MDQKQSGKVIRNEDVIAVDRDTERRADKKDEDYNKMLREGELGETRGSGTPAREKNMPAHETGSIGGSGQGTVGEASLPSAAEGSKNPPGGINTSNSTIGAGGTVGGGNPGLGSASGRGREPLRAQTMNSDPLLGVGERGMIAGQNPIDPQKQPGQAPPQSAPGRPKDERQQENRKQGRESGG